MTDVILILILALIIGLAASYIIRAKKRGQHCIGCPHAGQCGAHHHGQSGQCTGSCSGCCSQSEPKEDSEIK